MRSQTFAALVSKSGFLQRGPRTPLGATEAVLWGPRAEAEQGPQPKEEAKTRYFYWWAGGHKCWESFEGRHGSWKLENHCSKWYWQALLADPAIRGEQPGNSPSTVSKTRSVEYTRWVRPCLLSKIKSYLWFRWKPWQSNASFFTDHVNAYLKRNALRWKSADSVLCKLS